MAPPSATRGIASARNEAPRGRRSHGPRNATVPGSARNAASALQNDLASSAIASSSGSARLRFPTLPGGGAAAYRARSPRGALSRLRPVGELGRVQHALHVGGAIAEVRLRVADRRVVDERSDLLDDEIEEELRRQL